MFKINVLFLAFCLLERLKTGHQEANNNVQSNLMLPYSPGKGYLFPYPDEDSQCFDKLKAFAEHASNFTLCTILNARPITLCETCIENYVNFRDKYEELLKKNANGTSCGSKFLSQDRLNAVQEYHDNILSVWNMGKCNDCFDWKAGTPTLKSDTIHFYKLFNDTRDCINKNKAENSSEICIACMQSYEQLDEFYKSLSSDAIGVDSVCMDIVDAMNATRSTWSKTYNCCNLRRTPELVFLSCAGIISFLPVLYYIAVRYCGPIRDLPNVLKQSRFKQTILRGLSIDSRSD